MKKLVFLASVFVLVFTGFSERKEVEINPAEAERAATTLNPLKASCADTQETASPQLGGWILKPLNELFAASIYGSPNVDIAVPNGSYTLQLLLYEGWRSRSADIVIEGKTVSAAYDMFKEQGGNFDHGSVLHHTFTLADGNIDIEINGPLHLGGLILSKGKADSPDRVVVVTREASLDLKEVIKAINFGDTNDLNIGDVAFAAAAVNTTVDGVTNTADGDVYSGEFGQKLPQMHTESTAIQEAEFFNGQDFTGWSASERKYWSVKDGAIVGHSAVNVTGNKFIWSDVEVKDFYLAVDVKLTPDNRNAGIQFRSKKGDASGQAVGYQADVGAGVWGKLYHEHGRGKLDWNDNAVGAVKPGDWNRYEVLAVGHKIWTAINGKLCVAIEDPKGELSGKISFQIHGGPAQTVRYRRPALTHDPKIALENHTKEQLLAALPNKMEATKDVHLKPLGRDVLAKKGVTAISDGLVVSPAPASAGIDLQQVRPLLEIHCYRCHDGEVQEGEIRLDNAQYDFARERELWVKVEEQIATNTMPPEDPLLTGEHRLIITDWIKAQNEAVDWSAYRQAGHVSLPLLNRTEYENTVRALFYDRDFDDGETHFDFAASLSDDGVGDTGFSSDRDSPSLAMTSQRMEKYVRITEDVLDYYLHTDEQIVYTAEAEEMKATTAVLTPTENGVMIKANRDSLYSRWNYPRSGWYIIDVKAWGERVDNRACAEMVIYLDRDEVGKARLTSTRSQPGVYHCLVWIEKGYHTLRFRPQRAGMTEEEASLPVPPPFPDSPVIADFNDLSLGRGVYMCLDQVRAYGPVNKLPSGFNRNETYTDGLLAPPHRTIITQLNTPEAESGFDLAWEQQHGLAINRSVGHEKLSEKYTDVWVKPLVATDFSSPPAVSSLIEAEGQGRNAARQIISRFGRRAFRRPINTDDVEFFLAFYDQKITAGGEHRSGLKAALFAIMMSPDFFYRIPHRVTTDEERPLDSYEMASRLSYFLWNSMPDEELFALAKADKLADPEVLDQQVVRMLKDDRGRRMVGLFAREWLGYRELGVTIKPDDALFKNTYYANNIESLFKGETATFVNYVFSENRPLEELVTADYVFWNKRLAQYYSGPNFTVSELFAASIHGSPDVDIAVPNGSYTLQLLMYEGWQSRSADIVIEGETIRKSYNMFDEQGKTFDHGSVLRYTFTLTDGNIDIEFKEHSPNIHLGGLILSKGNGARSVSKGILKSNSDIDFKDVIKAINFGETRNLSIGNVKFTAAAVNTTVDGVTNKAAGDVHAGQFAQKLPAILKDKSHSRLADDLVKVQLSPDSSRGGLLGMGSVLTVTSHPTRTSAVDRGLWVYEKLFGKRLPDPPVVPALEEGTGEAGATRTFREVLEKHRENKQCASCHNKIDPIGFGLENFDAVGRWRKVDGGKPIDASGLLPGGRAFDGPSELKQKLVRDKAGFYQNMARTMLTYGLGRKLEFYDLPEVDKIVQQLLATEGQSHELFKLVAKSYPFTHRGRNK